MPWERSNQHTASKPQFGKLNDNKNEIINFRTEKERGATKMLENVEKNCCKRMVYMSGRLKLSTPNLA